MPCGCNRRANEKCKRYKIVEFLFLKFAQVKIRQRNAINTYAARPTILSFYFYLQSLYFNLTSAIVLAKTLIPRL